MKLSLAQKLVAAFLGLTLLVLAATLGLARWSFEQGFLDYVNALEQIRLERARDDLAQEYRNSDNSWSSVTSARFGALLARSTPRDARAGPFAGGAPPPRRNGHRPPPDRRGGPPPGNIQEGPPTGLFDAKGTFLVGNDLDTLSAQYISVPVVVDGVTVAELRSTPLRRVNSPLETAFSKQQLRTSWIIGLSCAALAFGVSLLLARGLLAPIRRMIKHVGELSNGHYAQRLNEKRADELGQLTRDLDRLGTTLEENQASRRRLLADISHELRTPLTVLTGEIEALQDGLREFDANQLASLDQEVQRLRHLVDDLYELSVSELGGLRYQFSTVDVTDSLAAAAKSLHNRASQKGIELVMPDAKAVEARADPARLHQLLCNLLENSLAYTDAPGRIELTLTRSDTDVIVQIEDTPPGVTQADCEKLFDPLYRQELSRSRRSGGAGLGLAICRNIIEAHNGSIIASPSALGGLCICVKLRVTHEDAL
jgi:two-component system sensor histidine kinase BaeS